MNSMNTRVWPALKVSGSGCERINERIAVEQPVAIRLNDVDVATLLCSPSDMDALAIGFLVSERYVSGYREVVSVELVEEASVVSVRTVSGRAGRPVDKRSPVVTSGCGGGKISRATLDLGATWCLGAGLKVLATDITIAMKEFTDMSDTFRATGGVHSAALFVDNGFVTFAEDIGRHNAVDKVLGRGQMDEVELSRAVLFTSGRISAEVTLKSAAHRVRVVVSRAAPTSLALDIARHTRVTVVGFARSGRMTVFTHDDRILCNQEDS